MRQLDRSAQTVVRWSGESGWCSSGDVFNDTGALQAASSLRDISRISFIFLGVVTIPAPCFAAITEVDVLSTEGWKSTGVAVTAGTQYGVWQTSGIWTVDSRNFRYVDGAGYSPKTDAMIYQGCKYNSAWPYGLLLGRIGDNIFPIGRGISFAAPQGGLLELSIHDNVNCLGDNAGALHVKIEDGVDERGLLGRLAGALRNTLTPTEQQRLLLVVRDIAGCQTNPDPFVNPACLSVVIGLFRIVLDPPGQVE